MQSDDDDRYSKMEYLNKVNEKIQSDTLEERLYLHLNNWKKTSAFMIFGFFGFFIFVVIITSLPPSEIGYELIGWVFIGLVVFSLVLWDRQRKKGRKIQREYERRQYFLILSSMEVIGENTLERFMDIVIHVFPEIKKKARRHGFEKDWWIEETRRTNDNKYDISISHKSGFATAWLVVKKFESKVSFDDIKKLYERDYGERKRKNIRIVAIAKEYDESFYTDEFEEQMKDLLFIQNRKNLTNIGKLKENNKINYKEEREERITHPDSVIVDLLIESKEGFSPLWLG